MNRPALADKPFQDHDNLSRAVLDLASKWGQALKLEKCCLLVELDCGRSLCAEWTPGQTASQCRLYFPESGAPCSDAGQGLPLLTDSADSRIRATLYGEPCDCLWSATPEWRELTGQFLLQNVRFDEELRRQKLEAMAQYAAGAGHEINNPLATIINRARQLLSTETDPEKRRWLETIGAQAYRIRDMIGDTMLFARPPAPQPVDVDLLHEVSQVMGRFADEFRQRCVSLFVSVEPQERAESMVRISADITQLKIVIAELIRNSLNAVADGTGVISFSIELPHDNSGMARLSIKDNGIGLTSESAEHLFDPFYSGRQAGRGLGFGLSKVWRIVQAHGGSISPVSGKDGGLAMVLHWPLANSTSLAKPAE